jgi:tetratricopeptide (TPR) repeat protein
MRRFTISVLLVLVFLTGCAPHVAKREGTLAELHAIAPDVQEVKVEKGLDQAMDNYRNFLKETPESKKTPEAMRRLADLELEKEYGIHTGDDKTQKMAAPQPARPLVSVQTNKPDVSAASEVASQRESEKEFERRTTAPSQIEEGGEASALPAGTPAADAASKGPLEAIAIYNRLLTQYPSYKDSDQVLYQMARAYDELGRTEDAMKTMARLVRTNPHSEHFDEVQFRRGEYFFTRRKYQDAENVYSTIIKMGPKSEYYELALYKLGWTFYKRERYEEALHRFIALLDHKVATGYDFDQKHAEEDQRRVADTFRVISLSFSNLGGPEAVQDYFSTFGNRSYEDRVYDNLGQYYLAKLRYDDAAKTYKTFIALYPFHRAAPHFSMKVVETFTKAGFPELVLKARREFASRYGLHSEYWKHFKPEDSPKVLAYLKTDLKDLATHYHAEYQGADKPEEKLADYHEAIHWYNEYLDSFPKDDESPAINYKLAGLLLENKDFGEAAKQFERTAYDYPVHAQSAAAGYAAVYAYRQELSVAKKDQLDAVKRDTVASSLKFADTFPDHPEVPAVLGQAADDMYEMKNYRPAVDAAQRIIDKYPSAKPGIRRSAWVVVAHGSFELADYPAAEHAFTQVLAATPKDDKSRPALVDNLAASIYKQGEIARDAKDYRAAANNFLRVRTAAPTSSICATAEYDAGSALIQLKDWPKAVEVFQTFRKSYPKHKLHLDAAKQIAYAYRESGQLAHAADEYNGIASESNDPALRSEALLAAGDLYEQTSDRDHALDVYNRYVNEFPKPVETALETRSKIAGMYKAMHDEARYHQELTEIVRIDANAGQDRTARTRTLAANAELVLAQQLYQDFMAVKLRQPFEASLKEKKQRMDAAIGAFGQLVQYEIADTTAAATYYMAETYYNFSRALKESERPTNLSPTDMQAYEDSLDEAAFPFEEKAIHVHEKNMEMLHNGVFDQWTKKSLEKLAVLMPGRYAKPEISSGFLASIDTYAYRSPLAKASGPTLANAGTAAATPGQAASPATAAANGGETKGAAPHEGAATAASPEQTSQPATKTTDEGAVKASSPQNSETTSGAPEQGTSPATKVANAGEAQAAAPQGGSTSTGVPEQTSQPATKAPAGSGVKDKSSQETDSTQSKPVKTAQTATMAVDGEVNHANPQ